MRFVKHVIILWPLYLGFAPSVLADYKWVPTNTVGGPENTTVYACAKLSLDGETQGFIKSRYCSDQFAAHYQWARHGGVRCCMETTPDGKFVQWVKNKHCDEDRCVIL